MRCSGAIWCSSTKKGGFKTWETHHGGCGACEVRLHLDGRKLRLPAELSQYKKLGHALARFSAIQFSVAFGKAARFVLLCLSVCICASEKEILRQYYLVARSFVAENVTCRSLRATSIPSNIKL